MNKPLNKTRNHHFGAIIRPEAFERRIRLQIDDNKNSSNLKPTLEFAAGDVAHLLNTLTELRREIRRLKGLP